MAAIHLSLGATAPGCADRRAVKSEAGKRLGLVRLWINSRRVPSDFFAHGWAFITLPGDRDRRCGKSIGVDKPSDHFDRQSRLDELGQTELLA